LAIIQFTTAENGNLLSLSHDKVTNLVIPECPPLHSISSITAFATTTQNSKVIMIFSEKNISVLGLHLNHKV